MKGPLGFEFVDRWSSVHCRPFDLYGLKLVHLQHGDSI